MESFAAKALCCNNATAYQKKFYTLRIRTSTPAGAERHHWACEAVLRPRNKAAGIWAKKREIY
jgi:hypothetical protein